MSNAYDKLDLNFLKAVLLAMNFSPNWVGWIMECVTTVQYTLLVNGCITQSFTPSKGLRQGEYSLISFFYVQMFFPYPF